MRTLILFFAFAALAQQPGSVTVTNTVTAVAGAITCTLSNPAPPAFTLACNASGGATLTQTATPAVGATSGIVGSFNVGQDAVTWIVKQESAGVVDVAGGRAAKPPESALLLR